MYEPPHLNDVFNEESYEAWQLQKESEKPGFNLDGYNHWLRENGIVLWAWEVATLGTIKDV